MAFSLDSKVKDILKNPAAAAVLDKYSPDASKNPQMKLVGGLTLRKLASFPQSAFLKPHLEELDKELQAIEYTHDARKRLPSREPLRLCYFKSAGRKFRRSVRRRQECPRR